MDDPSTDAGSLLGETAGDNPAVLHTLVSWAISHPDADRLVPRLSTLLQEQVEAFPNRKPVWLYLGHLAAHAQEHETAAKYFDRLHAAMQEDDPSPYATAGFYFIYGSVCERIGRYAQAERMLEACIEQDPQHDAALNYLAYTWAELGEKLDRAEAYSRRSLEIDPGNGAYLDTLAWVLHRQGRSDEALSFIREACEALPEDAVVHEHAGDILAALGRMREAAEAWERAYRIEANDRVAEKLKQAGRRLPDPETAVPGQSGTPSIDPSSSE